MRNGSKRLMVLTLPLTTMVLAGCQTTNKPDDLAAGSAALKQRDYPTAQRRLDAYLVKNPNGPKSAEAFYLKGRALQDGPSDDMNDAQGSLQQARLAYVEALKAGTDDRGLEGLIRASLADVAFYQEDYATAAQQGAAAYDKLDDADLRAKSLYCSGLSLQRLGRFADGDKTLKLVVQYHPTTPQAARAKERLGVRAFNVRLPFANTAAANGALATLTRQGFAPTPPSADAAVTVGPYQTYAQAKAARSRLNTQYPKAVIVP